MNDHELLRYSRHILLDGFDVDGQEALINSTVLIVGAGGLGCPAAMYLAAAGMGKLILCDDDQIELSNLQRQIAHQTESLGQDKVQSLAHAIKAINPNIAVKALKLRLTAENVDELLQEADVVLDCSDNFTTRFLLNRACVKNQKPLVSGAAVRTEGQVAVFDLRDAKSACYACLYSEQASADGTCSTNGVLAPLVGIVGSYQAAETIKLLTRFGSSMAGALLSIDLKDNQHRRFALAKDPDCPVCAAQAER